MAGRASKAKVLRFKNFPSHWHSAVFFVERGYDEQLNLSIIHHLQEIRQLLKQEDLDFVYFPYLISEVKDATVYNFPQMKNADFSYTASSDILLHLIEDERQILNLPPCVMQYDHTADGVDYVNAFPINIKVDADLLPWLERLLKQIASGANVFHSSITEYDPDSEKPILTADETFDDDVRQQMSEVYRQVKDLQLKGVSEWVLKQYLFPQKQLSRLVITEKYDIILPDYHDMQIKMEPLVKTVFILFLRHEEGIIFKHLSNYRDELYDIYQDICSKQEKPLHLPQEKVTQSIEALTNPLSNSINEKCAKVRAAFVSQFDESLAKYYYIDGKRGEAKKIILDRTQLKWEL